MKNDKHQQVQDYYGKELNNSNDLKTNACCTFKSYPKYISKAMANINDEVMSKYYGCGLTIPSTLKGKRILDLGSGSGRDAYLVSQLVGETGEVVGVDMTKEQLDIANKYLDWHREKFGYQHSNVVFKKGYLEDLDKLELRAESFDIIISNCVINLVKDKEKVLSHAFNLLKEGGEMYFSDVYTDRRIPQHLVDDPVLYGECLSGSLYTQDFITIAKDVGFLDPRFVESEPITIDNPEVSKKLSGFNFESITYRLFKSKDIERSEEDYGQAVIYKGGIENQNLSFKFDHKNIFLKGKVQNVSGNTFNMLKQSRLSSYFEFIGTNEVHFGKFHYDKINSHQHFNSNLDDQSTNESEEQAKCATTTKSSCC